MTDDKSGVRGQPSDEGDLIEIDLNFESMRRFQAEFSPNLSKDGLFIDTGEPLNPGSVVRFRVILPEDFVFLEGTAIVEWSRGAEMVTEGAPGMALRFATLSVQNQELVEQLVQDFVDAGGQPFDLDVRPVLGEFPTDALEGAPEETGGASETEGYRLTVRQTGPTLQEDALQALVEASPSPTEPTPEATGVQAIDDPEDVAELFVADDQATVEPDKAPENPTEAPVVDVEQSGEMTADDAAEPIEEVAAEPVAAVGEPPELEWPEEADPDEVESQPASDSEPEQTEPEGVAGQFQWADDRSETEQDEAFEPAEDSGGVVLDTPREFDDGPEVISDVQGGGLGGPAFDVSLPEADDDEPDTTPVLPDEGNSDVTVTTDDDDERPPSSRRLWPWVVAAVFVLAVAGGLLRPRVVSWLESRGADQTPVESTTAAAENVEITTPGQIDDAPVPPDTEPESVPDDAGLESGSEPPAVASGESAGTTVQNEPENTPDPIPTPKPEPVRLAAASAVESIDVATGPRGTVVRIRADGSLEDGVFSVEALTSPPRLLVRLRGIETGYRPYLIEPGTAEVTAVRIGHHAERRPPELWVVLDLAGDSPEVEDIDIRGDVAELVVADR